MNATQNHLTIADITEDIVLLKSGGACLILRSSAVNFDLLSETEQVAIIQSFAQMLNSLSFPIQVMIHSKRLDITSYLKVLDQATARQTNPLLSQLMIRYREFVQSLIRQNEVLDKHFFVVVPISGLEIGLLPQKKEDFLKKAKTMLAPRREQIARQLSRVGLKSSQLDTKALVQFFYDIYNPPQEQSLSSDQPELNQPIMPKVTPSATPVVSTMQVPSYSPPEIQSSRGSTSKNHPFVVEELVDTL